MAVHGQWLGDYRGTNRGTLLIDADDRGPFVEGHVFVFDDQDGLPTLGAPFTVAANTKQTSLTLQPVPLAPYGQIPEARLPELFPGVVLPTTITAQLELQVRQLEIKFETPIGTRGEASLPRSKAGSKSDYRPQGSIRSWKAFRRFVEELEPGRYIFRGQPKPFRLRTAFHRTRRKDLVRFITEDIPKLHRMLTPRSKHLFNLNDPMQNGAFWNLIQHHGYPTPLLDWSYSPFVAAYFAYRRNGSEASSGEPARIFMFDKAQWVKDYNQLQQVHFVRPHFSILEAFAIENERAMPQQALSSVTNVDDIETYIRAREGEVGKSYLRVFDLPTNDSEKILNELRLMGITAGAMFPGFDGICEELRTTHFA